MHSIMIVFIDDFIKVDKMLRLSLLILLSNAMRVIAKPHYFESEGMKLEANLIKEGLGIPWALQFLNPTRMIFTEREGNIKILDLKTKKLTPVINAPEVATGGQGGMLDLVLHPNFKKNSLLYITYSQKKGSKQTTRLTQYKLVGNQLKEKINLFTALPFYNQSHHYGSRIAIKGNELFLSVGDRGNRDLAQSLKTDNGKIHKIDLTGKKAPEIYSYGHRNPQGLFWDPLSGLLLETEHGPRGGDEINIIQKDKNYGWPIITYGKEYYGPSIGDGITKKKGMKQPIKYYAPSIAPCGFIVYQSDVIKPWKGDLFLGALAKRHLNRVTLKNKKAQKEERLLEKIKERFRSITEGPDGFIYFGTDSGKIYQIKPRS